jgi:hypothetical protein
VLDTGTIKMIVTEQKKEIKITSMKRIEYELPTNENFNL